MKRVELINIDKSVPNLGLGCMGMSEFYGSPSSDNDALRVMQAAYDNGIRMLDTADFYGDGDNERLIGKFLQTAPKDVVIATKCGIVRGQDVLEDGNFRRGYNNTPTYIKASCEASLKRLNVDCIDLFYLHRIDPKVPIEESMTAMADLVKEGKIKAIGLSEANATTLERAHKVHPVTALQSEYSLWTRGVEEEILPICRELGIAFVAYSPLGRGMVPTSRNAAGFSFEQGDFRLSLERATPENFANNTTLFKLLYDLADSLEISPFQLMLAWLMAQGDDIIPIPGTRKISRVVENVFASELKLPATVVDELSAAFSTPNVSGGRYTVNKSVTENATAMS